MQAEMIFETDNEDYLESIKKELTEKAEEIEKKFPHTTCTQMHFKTYKINTKGVKNHHRRKV